jgi:WD40 repeat protein
MKRFTSKHLAHTLVPLGYPLGLLTMSRDSLEFWDLKTQKRKRVLSTCYGQIEHGCVLSESYREEEEDSLMAEGESVLPKEAGRAEAVYNLRLVTTEDSRILRIWSHKMHLKNNRIVTKHNDVITRVLKIPGKHFMVTAAADGSIKCFVGKRQVGRSYSLKDLVTHQVIL